MDKNLITKLNDAGVSADIILGLILDDDQKPAQPADPAPAQPADSAPAEPADPAPPTPALDPILEAIKNLTGIVQAANIARLGSEGKPQEGADDILARVLRGHNEEDK